MPRFSTAFVSYYQVSEACKTVCYRDFFFRKDLSKVDSGSKTRSVQSENLKKLANVFKS